MPQAVDRPTDRPTKQHGDEPQDHGGEPPLHLTDERIRQRDRDPDGDELSQQGALQTRKKQKDALDGLLLLPVHPFSG